METVPNVAPLEPLFEPGDMLLDVVGDSLIVGTDPPLKPEEPNADCGYAGQQDAKQSETSRRPKLKDRLQQSEGHEKNCRKDQRETDFPQEQHQRTASPHPENILSQFINI